MPAIRDEEWFYAPSFKEGAIALQKNEKDVRFSGLILGQDALGSDEIGLILDAVQNTRTKSLCLDWFDVETESFTRIATLADDDFNYELDSFHLTMIDLSVPQRLASVSKIVAKNKHIVDLILTFCKINCGNVHLLADALKINEQILSLNINFNLLRRDGYLILAEAFKENATIRYLEAKLNKAEKEDLVEFSAILSEHNSTIEYLDLGQEDDIDGVIEKNKIPEEESAPIVKSSSKKEDALPSVQNENNDEVAVVPPAPAQAQETDLYTSIKNYLHTNKEGRVEREKTLKVEQLDEILENETPTIRASLKHCKIMMLGEKNTGKTFFAHCLVHQLYHPNDEGGTIPTRKLDKLSLARVTELGWTKITAFHHVDMIIAKRISTLPENVANRNKANEVCFQFPEQVIISDKDLKTDGLLAKEDKELLERLEINDDSKENNKVIPVFTPQEKEVIRNMFSNQMNDVIDKALRENNYPSFSIWDMDSPAGYDEIFSRFYNNHGMIFVFFRLDEVKQDPERALHSILKYLLPIDVAKADGKDFTSKVFLIGTYLDEVINQGIDDKLSEWMERFNEYNDKYQLADSGKTGHMNFLIENAPEEPIEPHKVLQSVKGMLQVFSVDLATALRNQYGAEIVPNDADDLLFFPLSNNLPEMCKQYRCDFDDITGINKFRGKIRSLLDAQEIKVINVMKSLRDAKIIDALIQRKSMPKVNEDDNRPNYITLKEFEELAATAGITSRAQIAILLRYLDVTGIVSWLSSSQTLQNLIILNPEYVINGFEKFYRIMSNTEVAAQDIEILRDEVVHQGLGKDFTNLTEHRVVSHDLLLERFLERDNYEYFKDFLLNCHHLNRINLKVLQKLFVKQDLCNYIDSDELYLVPRFGVKAKENTEVKTAFYPFKARFIPDGGLGTGDYERALTSLIDALGNDAMEGRLLLTENTLVCSDFFATFSFGDDVFTFAQIENTDVNTESSFLQYEFSSPSAATYLDLIERVLRNNLFIKESLVFADSQWVPLHEARQRNLEPYCTNGEDKNLNYALMDLEDAFDEL